MSRPIVPSRSTRRHGGVLLALASLVLVVLLSACAGDALGTSSWPGLSVHGDTAYVAVNNHVHAIDLRSQSLKWRFPNDDQSNFLYFARPALVGNGQLVVGNYNNVLSSLDPQTGAEFWSFDQARGRFIGGSLATEDGLFIPNADHRLYALDHNGRLRWSFETERPLWARPATDGRQIYLPAMDHQVYALDVESGRRIWAQDLGGAIVGTPAVSEDGVLYVGTFANQMVALESQGGQTVWQTPTDSWVWSGPALYGDRVYFGDLSGRFYALARADGQVLWSLQPDGPIVGTPLVTESAIYFTAEDGVLISINHEGAIRWTQTVDGKLYASPEAYGDLILVAPSESDALLLAYDPNGTLRWSLATE